MTCLTNHNRIKPATAPLASGDRAKFAASFAHAVAISAKILGWEWATANAGCIGLGNAKNKSDIGWAGSSTGCGLTCHSVA